MVFTQTATTKTVHSITAGEATVVAQPTIKLLGVKFDQELNIKRHIIEKSRIASLAMHKLTLLRKHLDKQNCLKLANALIFSHMDYCNSIFINLPKATVYPFQRIQNLTAKIIVGVSKYSSSTEALKELHILPIHVRAEYKLLVIVYKCVHGLAPAYLSDILTEKDSRRVTRSGSQHLLEVPWTRAKTFADRSLSVAGPVLWNKLPEYIKQTDSLVTFKKLLKTFLFTKTFN